MPAIWVTVSTQIRCAYAKLEDNVTVKPGILYQMPVSRSEFYCRRILRPSQSPEIALTW